MSTMRSDNLLVVVVMGKTITHPSEFVKCVNLARYKYYGLPTPGLVTPCFAVTPQSWAKYRQQLVAVVAALLPYQLVYDPLA